LLSCVKVKKTTTTGLCIFRAAVRYSIGLNQYTESVFNNNANVYCCECYECGQKG
jgi:hypothetical protein